MNRAMILCAGFGSRMGEYTKNCPKPLLPINGKPLLAYTLFNLVNCGIKEVALNLHYKGDQIKDYFQNGSKFGLEITYIEEDQPSGTAGGVKKLEWFLHDSRPFLVLYGDILTNQNFKDLIAFHRQKEAWGTIILHKRLHSNSIITFDDQNEIDFFLERPSPESFSHLSLQRESWVNSGLYCFDPEVLSLIPPNQFCDFPKDIFPQLIQRRKLFGLPLEGQRFAIDTPDKYQEALRSEAVFTL